MFVSTIAWASSPMADYLAAAPDAGQGTSLGGLATIGFAVVFASWVLLVVIQATLRMRREEREGLALDLHTLAIEGLGTAMADGGEPSTTNERGGRGQSSESHS
jgi:hypothetical protein